MMKRGFFILCALLVAATTWGSEPQTVKVGVNIGLSGRGLGSGTHELKQSIMLAQKQLNERENAPYHYELIFEDNKYTPAGAVMAGRKLINIDRVDALITIYDFAVSSTKPLFTKAKVPSLGFSWGVNFADGEYSFVFGYSEIACANALYEGLIKDPNNPPTTIMAVKQASIPNLVKHVQRRCKEDGRPVVEGVFFNPNEIDFRTTLLKLQVSGCKRLALVAWGNELDKLLYQLNQMPNFNPELWGYGPGMRVAEARETLADSYVYAPPPPSKEFIRTYREYTGHDYLGNDPYGYDTLKLLAQSLEESPKTQGTLSEQITKALRSQKNFKGVTGKYTQKNGVFDTPVLIYRLTEDGEEPFLP